MALTPEQHDLVEAAFADLTDDIVANGVQIFQSLFARYPDDRDYFLDEKESAADAENAELRGLVTHVLTLLRAWVLALRDEECLKHLLRHHKRKYADDGLTVNKFRNVGPVVVEFLEKKLGEKFDESSKDAVKKAFSKIGDGLEVDQ